MKTSFLILTGMAIGTGALLAQGSGTGFTNFIRQVQLPANANGTYTTWNVPISSVGEILSPLAINPGGARFELWTINSTPLTEYLLDSKYVGNWVPMAGIKITSEDPYSTIPRTRVDRSFTVRYSMKGLRSGATDPEASKKVHLLQHVQGYGAGGTGIGINRDVAIRVGDPLEITQNTPPPLDDFVTLAVFQPSGLLGAPLGKARGEQRFSIYSLPDYQAPASQLASQFIQIWPLASGTISGITEGQLIRFAAPPVTFSLTDLYPSSNVYAQVYKGPKQLGKVGTIVPGSSLVLNETIPQNRVLTISNWDRVMDTDGEWTIELVGETVFDVAVFGSVTFKIDRTIQVNGNLSTMD